MSSPKAGGGFLERPWAFWAMVAAASLLGAYLRLHDLGKPSLWVDEFFTISRAGADPMHWTYAFGYLPTRLSLWLAGVDLSRISLDNIVQWQSLGVTERDARLGPCWIGIASVPALALLARPVVGGGVAGVAALLVACLPFHLYWSQMARYYTTEFLFANAFLLLFARGMQTGNRLWFASASGAAILAFASHFTAVFVVGACLGVTALAWLTRVPLPHLRRGVLALAGTAAVCALMLLLKELESEPSATLGAFSTQSWDPPVATLVLGTVLRIEPVIFTVGVGWVLVAIRRRDPLAILVSVIAVLVPLGVLALNPLFPIGQRYYFASLYAWALLAGMWCVEVDRRLSASASAVVGTTGLLAVLVSVGFNTWGYNRDGAGARARWREAYEYVLRHGSPEDAVFAGAGQFQARYYLGRPASELRSLADPDEIPAGSWVVHRSRGDRRPPFGEAFEEKGRYEIPSKPWSWVVYLLHKPRP